MHVYMDLEIYILFWTVELSIVPLWSNWKNEQDCLGLKAVNGLSSITFGTQSLTLDLGLWCVFHWIFVIADNSTPIIEVNFLQEHGFLVNMRHGFIMNMLAYLQVKILFFILYHPAHLSNCSKVTKNVIPYWLNFPQSPNLFLLLQPCSETYSHSPQPCT